MVCGGKQGAVVNEATRSRHVREAHCGYLPLVYALVLLTRGAVSRHDKARAMIPGGIAACRAPGLMPGQRAGAHAATCTSISTSTETSILGQGQLSSSTAGPSAALLLGTAWLGRRAAHVTGDECSGGAGGACRRSGQLQQRGDEAWATDRLDPICIGSSCGWWWCCSSKTQVQDEALWTHQMHPCSLPAAASCGSSRRASLARVHCRCRKTRRLSMGTTHLAVCLCDHYLRHHSTTTSTCSSPALGFRASLQRAPLLPQDTLDCGSWPSPHRPVQP